ncbi:hypothetical protein BMS3Abin14_00733 [bacterium BMS3Abin14]|nr:hypothetical protein BMS3Abin14_00733 [bacterium BMS3Abin14]
MTTPAVQASIVAYRGNFEAEKTPPGPTLGGAKERSPVMGKGRSVEPLLNVFAERGRVANADVVVQEHPDHESAGGRFGGLVRLHIHTTP